MVSSLLTYAKNAAELIDKEDKDGVIVIGHIALAGIIGTIILVFYT